MTKEKNQHYVKTLPVSSLTELQETFYGEALRIAEENNQEKFKQIDSILKNVAGFRMGHELMDLIGIDVNYDVTCSVWQAFNQAERFAPHELQKYMVDNKRLGKKPTKDFMIMSKVLLVYNKHTAIIDQIKNSQFDSVQYNELGDTSAYDYIFDFTYLPVDEKHDLCEKLNNCNEEFFTDLTACSNKEFHERYSKLMGSFSALLVTDQQYIEFFCQGNKDEVIRVLSDLSLEPQWYDYYGIGFVYPRVLPNY